MIEYAHVGSHADILASGRPVAPGDRVWDTDLADEDSQLVDEGRLVDVTDFDGASNDALSHRELRERAAELEIEGRSRMSVTELRTAVAERETAEGVANAA